MVHCDTMKKRDKDKPVSLMVRLPPEIHREIKHIADKEDRSLNKQVIRLLRFALEARSSKAK